MNPPRRFRYSGPLILLWALLTGCTPGTSNLASLTEAYQPAFEAWLEQQPAADPDWAPTVPSPPELRDLPAPIILDPRRQHVGSMSQGPISGRTSLYSAEPC